MSIPSVPRPRTTNTWNHLSVFNVLFPDDIFIEAVESNCVDKYSEVRVGDIVIHFAGLAFEFNSTEWGIIITITNRIDSDGNPQCTIFLSSFNTLLSEHHSILSYRYDEDNTLQDVTAWKFVSMKRLLVVDGEMKSGTYYSPIDCMKDIF